VGRILRATYLAPFDLRASTEGSPTLGIIELNPQALPSSWEEFASAVFPSSWEEFTSAVFPSSWEEFASAVFPSSWEEGLGVEEINTVTSYI